MKDVLERIEGNPLWEVLIFISIIGSVFGPPVAIILGAGHIQILVLIFLTNILFVFDSIIKTINHGLNYIFSIDFIIDISAIISAGLEFVYFFALYQGPMLANLRVLRSMKLISRTTRSFKSLVRTGKITRISTITRSMKSLDTETSKEGPGEDTGREGIEQPTAEQKADRYVATIRSKMQIVVMLLMGYIIVRFGAGMGSQGDEVAQAWHDILFFSEMIAIMIVSGGIIDYYLHKLVGERFQRIQEWVEHKSREHGFFKDVHSKAHNQSQDELDFLERYIGMVLDKAGEFPASVRKFLWGTFQPEVKEKVIFLSDIENYSEKTAGLTARQINQLLDRYIKSVVHILSRYGGEVDKYVGDSVIAFFDPQDIDNALKAAQEITSLRGTMRTRIGLHIDNVIETYVGPKGYRQMDHFSEGVSIAQRLEDHNKKVGLHLLMSDTLYKRLSSPMKKMCKHVGRFRPKGAKREVRTYTLTEL